MTNRRSDWVAAGREAITQVLAAEGAAARFELEARISDRPWQPGWPTVQPHILSFAIRDLLASGQIREQAQATRGKSTVRLLLPDPIPAGRRRAIEDAAARKRLLVARHHSWSRGSASMPNLIGQAGEAVVHNSLRAAAPTGYRVVSGSLVKGEVATLFGEPVPGGSLDNAAWLSPMDVTTQTPTGQTYLIPVEVKNLRQWLYPTAPEVYQLLHKAAQLQAAQSRHPMMPILICRKAHDRLRWMGSDLGFMVFETRHQYVYPSERVDEVHFAEVRDELGLLDLELTAAPSEALVTWLSGAVQRNVARYAERWASVGAQLADTYGELRRDRVPFGRQIALLEDAHQLVGDLTGEAKNWATDPDVTP